MDQILIDARRRMNSGIGRVTQWLVNNINEDLYPSANYLYLASEETVDDYHLNLNNTIVTEVKPFSYDDLYKIPSIIAKRGICLYVNPQVYSSPFDLVKSIKFIHDLWPLLDDNWLPTSDDLKKRFDISEIDAVESMSEWLTDFNAKAYLTDYGYSRWKSIDKSNREMRYVWSQFTAISMLSSFICTVSDATLEYYKMFFRRTENVFCIPLSLNQRWKKVVRTVPKHFLCISKLEERKNIITLLNAYEIYCDISACKYSLCIVGDSGYYSHSKHILNKIEELNRDGKHVSYLSSVTDEIIEDLFKEAIALIYPTKFEGYGLPPLEAMSAGVPVIATKVGMMACEPGNYVTIVDQDNYNNIASIMKHVSENRELYDREAILAKAFINNYIDDDLIRHKWKDILNRALSNQQEGK